MKKTILSIITCIFAGMIIISCNSTNSTQNKKDQEATEQAKTDSSKTITAKYLSGGSLEGDAIFIFEKENKDTIEFYRNYFNPKEPKIKYNFLSEEGVSGNKELIGKMFIIKYIVNPTGQISMVSGKGEPCNQIISVEEKK